MRILVDGVSFPRLFDLAGQVLIGDPFPVVTVQVTKQHSACGQQDNDTEKLKRQQPVFKFLFHVDTYLLTVLPSYQTGLDQVKQRGDCRAKFEIWLAAFAKNCFGMEEKNGRFKVSEKI